MGLNGTYIVNLVRPQGYQGRVMWYVQTIPTGGVDWTATTTYKVPAGYTHYVDINGNVFPVVGGTVTVGASPILLENHAIRGQS
jgi:hypothetical protein